MRGSMAAADWGESREEEEEEEEEGEKAVRDPEPLCPSGESRAAAAVFTASARDTSPNTAAAVAGDMIETEAGRVGLLLLLPWEYPT